MKKICIIIVNWNRKNDTLACLTSLKKIARGQNTVEIVVVDNDSSDGSVEEVTKKFPEVTVLPSKTNDGFTGGNNRGMRYAYEQGADFVWLLNNDTMVHTNVLLGLLAAFKDNTVGLAGSKIYFAPGCEFHHDRYKASESGRVIWYAGGLVDWANMYASHRGVDEVDVGQYDQPIDTSFVTGCSMMIARGVIEAVGYLDDKFFLYLEDFDYSLRVKRAGFRVMYCPKSILWHINAGSTGKPGHGLHQYYLTRNRLLVGMRYGPFRTKVALIREAFRFIIIGPSVLRRAVLDFFFGKFGNRYTWKA